MKMFLSLLFIAIVAIVIVAASGTYNISATEKHWSIVEKAITWARNNSIDTHAKNLVVSKFDEKEVLSSGWNTIMRCVPNVICHQVKSRPKYQWVCILKHLSFTKDLRFQSSLTNPKL